jgi:hypothetical protein
MSPVVFLGCVLVSAFFAALRIDGFRSQSFQAFAHGLVFGLFVSGIKNVSVEIGAWRAGLRSFPLLEWYQIALGVALSVVEILVFLGLVKA